jgi:hypothetical protein
MPKLYTNPEKSILMSFNGVTSGVNLYPKSSPIPNLSVNNHSTPSDKSDTKQFWSFLNL